METRLGMAEEGERQENTLDTGGLGYQIGTTTTSYDSLYITSVSVV